MTASRLVTIFCDGLLDRLMGDGTHAQCGEWDEAGVGANAAEARRNLKGRGWLLGLPDGRDLCPEHRDQYDPDTMEITR